jgi:hypothetical protein
MANGRWQMTKQAVWFSLLCAWFAGALAAPSAVVTFAVIGDFGSDYPSTHGVANLVKRWRPDFILTVGDNNYPSGSARTIDKNVGQFYHEFIYGYKGRYGRGSPISRFFPALGNHDWLATNAQPYLDYFTLPGNERYYTFTNGPTQFFCLDSDKQEPDGCTIDSVQGHWVKRGLTESMAPWKIVYFHHAPFSSGYLHGTYTNECTYMKWPFKEWGASVVLAGHDHIYERVYTNGLVYFVNGLGGDSRDQLHYPLVAGSQRQFSADFGAMHIRATETNIVFRFITQRNNLIDEYWMQLPQSAPTHSPAARVTE